MLLESIESWNNEAYEDDDFLIDSIIRRHNDLSEKGAGKPPYQFIRL